MLLNQIPQDAIPSQKIAPRCPRHCTGFYLHNCNGHTLERDAEFMVIISTIGE
jgi:hypothetical protein